MLWPLSVCAQWRDLLLHQSESGVLQCREWDDLCHCGHVSLGIRPRRCGGPLRRGNAHWVGPLHVLGGERPLRSRRWALGRRRAFGPPRDDHCSS